MSYIIDDEIYARVIDYLADHEGQPAVRLAMQMDEDGAKVKRVLREAEELGQVVRTGRARGTLWWLG
ncbi:MAG: hypothetical protein KC912_20270 [Proteobacteria bacterium]|nr:hypothetical protein [Pseudomonadota bacterium]